MKIYLVVFIVGTVVGALIYAQRVYVQVILLYLLHNWIGIATLVCTMVGVYYAYLTYLNSIE